MDLRKFLAQVEQKAAEGYAQNTLARASVQLIPYVGSSLDTLIAGIGSRLVAKRQELLMAQLKEDIGRLSADKVDFEYVHSEEFLHLFIKGLEHAARVAKVERVKLLSKALAGATTKEWGKQRADDSEALVDLVASMSVEEVVATRAFYDFRTKNTGKVFRSLDERNEITTFMSGKGEALLANTPERVLVRLQARGLIREISGDYKGYHGGAFTPTGLAVDVIELLLAVGADEPFGDEPGNTGLL